MSSALSVAPMIAVIRRKYIRIFKQQKAFSTESAITPEDFGMRRRFIFRRLVRQGVLVAAPHDAFYLNTIVEQELQKKRRKVALIILFLLIIFGLVMYQFAK